MQTLPTIREGPARGHSLSWTSAEVAWPLAIAAGFGGTWLGALTGLPALAALFAAAGFAPLFLRFVSTDRSPAAALYTLGWALGIAGAIVGLSSDGQASLVRESQPLAQAYLVGEYGEQLTGEGWPIGLLLARDLAALGLVALLARPARGLLGLLLLALLVGTVASEATLIAPSTGPEAEGAPGLPHLLACAFAPHTWLSLVAAMAWLSLAACSRPLLPLTDLVGRERRLAVLAGSLLLAGVLARLLVAEAWKANHLP